MRDRKIEKVRKRDGTIVGYDESRIAKDICQAAQAAGIDARFLASDLASVVSLYLARYHGDAAPETSAIQEMVEKVLVDTANQPIARAYMRARNDAAPAVAPAGPPAADDLFPAGRVFVEASTRSEASAWDRRRIARALVKEAGLEDGTADEIAAVVEAKIFHAGDRRVTTATIRRLADHELYVRGLSGKLQRQSVVGVPKFDLDRLVQAGAADPARVGEAVGETTLRQYALEELFEGDVADAHVNGAIHIGGLDHPLKLAWLAPSVEHVKRHGVRHAVPGVPEVPDGPRSLTLQLRAVVQSAPRFVSDAVELVHAETFYAPLAAGLPPREVEREAADLASVLAAPPGLALGVLPTIHLHVPRALRRLRATGANATGLDARYEDLAGAALAVARGVLAALRAVPPAARAAAAGGPPALRGTVAFVVDGTAFHDPARLAVLRDACAFAAAAGDVRFVFDREEDFAWPASRLGRFPSAGDGAASPESAWFSVAQAVYLNLPQAAFRGEPGDLDGFFDRLDEVIAVAVRAHAQKARFLRRFHGDADTCGQQAGWLQDGCGALRLSEAVHLVVPVGLGEAVRHLAGRGIGESEDAVKAGVRVLSYLFSRVRDEARRVGQTSRLRIEFGDYPGAEACERLARIDVRAHASGRDGSSGTPAPYTPSARCPSGVPLSLSERLAIESRFHTLLPAGSVAVSFPPGVPRSGHDILALLQKAWAETTAAQVHIV